MNLLFKTVKSTRLIAVSLLAIVVSGCQRIDEMLGLERLNDSAPAPVNPSPAPINPLPTPSPPPSESLREQVDNFIYQRGCFPPNQTEYIDGIYRLGWTASGYRYEGLLQMEGSIGQMRITYFNPETNSSDFVDQYMVLANCSQGLVMMGLNPTDPETNEQHSSYVADNLLFRREPSGELIIANCDGQGECWPVEFAPASY